jgi:hypothetical protein
VARNSAGVPAVARWARQAGRLIADNQPLLLFPVVGSALTALLVIPLVVATRPATDFDTVARDAVFRDERVVHLLDVRPGAAGWAALAFLFVATAATRAWLGGAFIRSLDAGSLRWSAGARTSARLFAIYVVSDLFGLLAGGALGLIVVMVSFVLFGYADYVIVFEGRRPVDSVRRSVEAVTHAPLPTLIVFVAVFLAETLVYGLFEVPIHDADHVQPLLFAALLLVDGLLAYAWDCALIAVLYGQRLTRS